MALNRVTVMVPLPLTVGSRGAYDYAVPNDMALAPGDYVAVTIARQKVVGVVWDTAPDANLPDAKVKPVSEKLDIPPLPAAQRQLVEWVAAYTLTPPGAVLRMVLAGPGALQTPLKRAQKPKAQPADMQPAVPTLNDEQQPAADVLKAAAGVVLLDGVTGSGKTEVFCEAIAKVLAAGKQALVLLPEIALSAQLITRLARRFGFAPTEWHSELTPAQRRRNWHAIAKGEARLVVGARSASMLPFANLGLIVIDEEHEHTYKQEDTVLYHARDMAIVRGHLEKIPVILSTATPSLETWANVKAGKYQHVQLTHRYAAAKQPTMQLVDLKIDKPQKTNGRQSWLAPSLVAAMKAQMEKGEQTLLYLNRRGYAPLTLCRNCGHRFQCPQCATWLVSHDHNRRLLCHHCGYGQSMPQQCPACSSDQLAACGPGVERIADEVAQLFPNARRAILTSDIPEHPKEMRALIDDMAAGNVDILIGTQIVTKGHHFPNLTLVGVIDADLGLAGGDLRAAERTYQILTQVSGRAGRAAKAGHVLVQTTEPTNPLMQNLAKGARDAFLAEQLREREMFKMPPAGRLAALIISGADLGQVERAGKALAAHIPSEKGVTILGPAPAPIARLRGRYRSRFLIKAGRDTKLQALLARWLNETQIPRSVRVAVDIDPYSFL